MKRPFARLARILLLGGSGALAQPGPTVSIDVTGEIQPAEQTELKCNVSGRVKKVHVSTDDHVNAGDLLMEIDAGVEAKAVDGEVRATEAGIIVAVPVIERQSVFAASDSTPATTLILLGDDSKLIVQAHVRDEDIAKLRPKQPVLITAKTVSGEQMQGEVALIAPVATVRNSVKGYTVQVAVDHPNPKFRLGARVQMTIPAPAGKE